jgi:transcription termination factor NusB
VHKVLKNEYIELSKDYSDKAAEYWIQALIPGARNCGKLNKIENG